MAENTEVTFADFERYFPYAPAALAIKECARLSAIRKYECPEPILDVGCGDGLFAQLAFEGRQIWGIDIDASEGRHAHNRATYSQVILGDVTRAQMPESFFASCLANCSLEHIPRLPDALVNIRRSLRQGADAFLFVPNKDWASHMLLPRLLEAVRLPSLAKAVQQKIDTVFRHHHLHDEQGWRQMMVDAGFEVVSIEPVLSTATTVGFELLLLPSLLGLVNKKLTTRWTNFPGVRRAAALPAYAVTCAAMAAGDTKLTAEYLVRVRRPAGKP
jgi:SAM-dependent methyltransferase